MKLTRPAYAKANLFLTVPGRLENGYHLIRSLIVPLELCDSVSIEVSDAVKFGGKPSGEEEAGITCSTIISEPLQEHLNAHRITPDGPKSAVQPGAELITPLYSGSNICVRAARLLLDHLSIQKSVSIKVIKRIPIGAGLGGGSTDAAAVLLGLNELLAGGFSEGELCSLGSRLGSDVPAAIMSRPVFIYGTGNLTVDFASLLRPEFSDWLNSRGVVLVKPPYPVMTETAYFGLGHRPELPSELAQTDDYRTDTRVLALLEPIIEKSAPGIPDQASEFTHELTSSAVGGNSEARSGNFQNDFETSVYGRHPDLARLAELLTSGGAEAAFLAGSGSTVIGLFDSAESAGLWAERFRDSEAGPDGDYCGAFVDVTSFRVP